MKYYSNITCLTVNWRKFVQVCCNNSCNDCFLLRVIAIRILSWEHSKQGISSNAMVHCGFMFIGIAILEAWPNEGTLQSKTSQSGAYFHWKQQHCWNFGHIKYGILLRGRAKICENSLWVFSTSEEKFRISKRPWDEFHIFFYKIITTHIALLGDFSSISDHFMKISKIL